MPMQETVRDAYSARAQEYIGLFDGGRSGHEDDVALVRRHLGGLGGPVLDLGCGPGHWTADLHAWGADVTGVDMVPEFIEHARATHQGPEFRLGSMTEVDVGEHSVSGILSWYSTIHLPPGELDRALAGFRRLLRPAGVLVIGFFDSDDDRASGATGDDDRASGATGKDDRASGATGFDHAVVTTYRWPVDVFARRLTAAGFVELERVRHRLPERPDRRYAALAARAC